MLHYKMVKAQDVKVNDVLLLDNKEIRITRDAVCEESDAGVLVNLEYYHVYDMQFNFNQEVKVIDFSYMSPRASIINENNKIFNKKVRDVIHSVGVSFLVILIFLCGLIFVVWLIKTIWYMV